jgi:hypothetical protein
MKNTFSASEIVSVLQGEGYRALYEHDGIDNAYISSGSQGNFWEINIGDTQDDEQMGNILITYLMSVNPIRFPVGKICNQFNTISPNGVATFRMDDNHDLTEDVMISLDFSVSLTGGVADEWLEDSVSMWDYILGTFDKTVRECEEPTAKNDPF